LYNLLVSYRKRWINSLGAEWRTDLQLGNNNSVISEFYQPLNAGGHFFIAPSVFLERITAPVYQGNNRLATIDRKKAEARLDLGINFNEWGAMRLGILGGTVKREVDTGSLPFPVDSDTITLGAYSARLIFDQLDSVHFPREGWKFDASYLKSDTGLGADDSYTKWGASGNFVRSFGEHTFNLYAALQRPFRFENIAGLRPDCLGWLPGAVRLFDRSIARRKPEVWPRHVLPPTGAQFHFRGRLRRYFARDRQDEPSGDCNQPRRLDPFRQRVRRGRHAARTGLSGLRKCAGRPQQLLLLPGAAVLMQAEFEWPAEAGPSMAG
jgi:hypothetical protein